MQDLCRELDACFHIVSNNLIWSIPPQKQLQVFGDTLAV